MTNPGHLDFFILEASEYIEQMDGLLAAAGQGPPNADEMMRHARALRGSAMMARMPAISELAGGLERAGKALRDGLLMWEPGIHGVVTSAIDDVKILLRAVRTWGDAEDQRAQARIAELAHWVPGGPRLPTPVAPTTGLAFFADEASGIAKAIDAFLARTGDRGAVAEILRRARAVRGIASIRDIPTLGDVIEAVERAVKPLELSAAAPSGQQLSVLTAASTLLRDMAQTLGTGELPPPDDDAARRFAAAAGALADSSGDADVIVPIATLFHRDAGPHLVTASPTPPTTPAQRFRLEVVSQAEHLRGLVAEARAAADPSARSRAGTNLRSALRALKGAAEGFGEHGVTGYVDAALESVSRLDPLALSALDEAAALLADPGTQPADLYRRLGELSQARALDGSIGVGFGRASTAVPMSEPSLAAALGALSPRGGMSTPAAPPTAHPPAARPAAAAPAVSAPPGRGGRGLTPTGLPLDTALEQTLARFGGLDESPLSEPAPVPIESLMYRGSSALMRAREIRDTMQGGGAQDPTLLAELFDLLDLAAAE